MVPVVRTLLKRTGLDYKYLDIRQDEAARLTLKSLNGGYETVPTIVFPDGHHVSEPSMLDLRSELKQLGYEMVKLSAREIMRAMLLGISE
jgi:mycoredoxin